METFNAAKIQDELVVSFASFASEAWDRLKLHYENVDIGSGKYAGKYEQYVVMVFCDGKELDGFDLNMKVINVLRKLRGQFPSDGRKVWKWLELSVDSSGTYDIEYK